jgi:hypothetical protein
VMLGSPEGEPKVFFGRVYAASPASERRFMLGSAQAQPEVTTASSSDAWLCPKCGGPMLVIERCMAAELQLRSPPAPDAVAA